MLQPVILSLYDPGELTRKKDAARKASWGQVDLLSLWETCMSWVVAAKYVHEFLANLPLTLSLLHKGWIK